MKHLKDSTTQGEDILGTANVDGSERSSGNIREAIQDQHVPDTSRSKSELAKPFSTNKLWRLRHRSTLPAAIILSCLGGISLLFSYFESSLILTFIGLGGIFWGAIIFYISPSRLVRADVIEPLISPMQKSFDALVNMMGYTGEAIFFHPRTLKGLAQGYVFISHYANSKPKVDVLSLLPYSNTDNIPQAYVDPKGIFLASPSQRLIDLFEKELQINFATVNFAYLQGTLPKLLIEDLEVVDNVTLAENDDAITVTISGGPFVKICQQITQDKGNTNHTGCPICSALALVISKIKAMPISIKESISKDSETISTKFAIKS